MSDRYLLIASRDPWTHAGIRSCCELAADLAREGQHVTLFLVQNGVLPARPSPASAQLEALSRQGNRVVADELSLRERGIAPSGLAPESSPESSTW